MGNYENYVVTVEAQKYSLIMSVPKIPVFT